jgi:hypothetical protein
MSIIHEIAIKFWQFLSHGRISHLVLNLCSDFKYAFINIRIPFRIRAVKTESYHVLQRGMFIAFDFAAAMETISISWLYTHCVPNLNASETEHDDIQILLVLLYFITTSADSTDRFIKSTKFL